MLCVSSGLPILCAVIAAARMTEWHRVTYMNDNLSILEEQT